MKKLIYAIFFLGSISSFNQADGQESRFNIGYGFSIPACRSILRDEFIAGRFDDARIFYRALPARIGTGSTFSASYERMVTKNIGAEIGFSYQTGMRTIYWMFPDVTVFLDGNPESNYYSEGHSSTRTTTFLFSPAVVYHISGQGVRPYVKAGFVAGTVKSASQTLEYNKPEFNSASAVVCRSSEQSSGSVLGATLGFGVQMDLGRNIRFFTELNYSRMTYFAGHEQSPQFSFDGEAVTRRDSHITTGRGSVAEQLKATGGTAVGVQLGFTFRIGK